jgi:preprotein translocase subunit SecE
MRIKTYLQESYNELIHKVSWPTTAELQNSAIVVMIASLIIALIIFGMDTVFENLMETIYGILY